MNSINFAPFPILTTEKLKLRRLKLEDDNEIHFLRSDEAVNKYIDRPKTINKIDAEKFIKKINYGIDNNEWIYWAITRKEKPLPRPSPSPARTARSISRPMRRARKAKL